MINTWNPAEIMDKVNQLEAKIKAEDVEANPTGEATETLTKIGIDGDIYSFTAETDADNVSYDNTTTGLTADDVQEAIDELNSSKMNNIIRSDTPLQIAIETFSNLEIDNDTITITPAHTPYYESNFRPLFVSFTGGTTTPTIINTTVSDNKIVISTSGTLSNTNRITVLYLYE